MKDDFVVIRGEEVPKQSAANHWLCGCGAQLELKLYLERGVEWRVVCSKDESHSPDTFVPKRAFEGKASDQFQFWDKMRKETDMPFVKDRHDEEGRIKAPPRVRVAGRINLGEKAGSGARPVPYFIVKVYEKGAAGDALLSQVMSAINHYAPGQENPAQPTVLPVYLPANNIELVAASEYRLAGKEGRPRCVGDGETIQFKLGARNLMEVYEGVVVVESIEIDGKQFFEGDSVPCPGRDFKSHWAHCAQCRFTYEGKFQIAGLPYIFTLKTGDQQFYTQYFTVLEMMGGHVQQGHARFMSEIPLLLRRVEGEVFRPSDTGQGIQLTPQDMPLLNIEIHPMWLMQVEAPKTFALDGGTPMQLDEPVRKRIAAPAQSDQPPQEPQRLEPRSVTVHDDGLPGVPFKNLLGDWSSKAATRKSVIANAVQWLGMTEEGAGRAYEEHRTSVSTLSDLWTCLRQHVQASMSTPEAAPDPEAEVAESPEPDMPPEPEAAPDPEAEVAESPEPDMPPEPPPGPPQEVIDDLDWIEADLPDQDELF